MAQGDWNPSSLCLVAIASHESQQRSESTGRSTTRPPNCDFGLGSRVPPRCLRTRCLKTERGCPIPLILHGFAFIFIATPIVYGSSLKTTSWQLTACQPALGNRLAKSESPYDCCCNRRGLTPDAKLHADSQMAACWSHAHTTRYEICASIDYTTLCHLLRNRAR